VFGPGKSFFAVEGLAVRSDLILSSFRGLIRILQERGRLYFGAATLIRRRLHNNDGIRAAQPEDWM